MVDVVYNRKRGQTPRTSVMKVIQYHCVLERLLQVFLHFGIKFYTKSLTLLHPPSSPALLNSTPSPK